MLRTVALLLLLANALLLAGQWGLFDRAGAVGGPPGSAQQREPERLARQVNPQAVTVLTPQAASAAADAASASAAQIQTTQAAASFCLEAGPFGAAETEAAERTLRETGLAAGSWLSVQAEDRGAYLIYIGRFADREALQVKREQLNRLHVDAEELSTSPNLQPGLSLGRFADKPAADAALAQMQQRGVRTARVVALRPPQGLTVLRLPAADAAVRARLAGLRLPSGPGFVACVAHDPAAASAASAASAAPASASVNR